MQKSNVNPCPHYKAHAHTIRTSDGRTAVLCDACHSELLSRLSDHSFVGGMIKSTMPTEEVLQVRYERENAVLRKRLENMVAVAHAAAGYPRHLMITESAGVM